jgi:hypothetical protein
LSQRLEPASPLLMGFSRVLAGVSVFFQGRASNKHESHKMRRWQTATGYRGVYILATDVQEFCGLTYGEQIFSHTER